MSKQCNFCKDLAFAKEHIHHRNKDYTTKYAVALVSETYCREQYTGNSTQYGYPLNYCPECGARMEVIENDIHI